MRSFRSQNHDSARWFCSIAYLLGAIPFGYLLVKWKTGADVRAAGSGNIGATNVMRTTGRAAGVATLLLDIAKGYLPSGSPGG